MKKEKFYRLIDETKVKDERGGAAFNELYNFFFPKIVRHISAKYKDYCLGEDIAQDFFFNKLLKDGIRIDDDIENPLAWVYTVSENLLRDRFKSEIIHNAHIAGNPPSDTFSRTLYMHYLDQIEKLEDPLTREIIKLRMGGYDLKEIAKMLKLKHNTVRQRYSRGVKKII